MTLRTMYTGVSGLRAEASAIGVSSDNIANVNTTGFKRQRAIFEDVLGRSVGGGSSGAGAGVRLGAVEQEFSQGALGITGVATDVALNGDGFLTLNGSVNGVTGSFFSRAGQLRLDAQGGLVNVSGLEVMGYAANADGTFQASVTGLRVPSGGIPARPTTRAEVVANIDSSSVAPTLPWDAQDAANTANFSTSLTVYDSLGASHDLELFFRKVADGQWDYHALVSGDDVDPAQPGLQVEVGAGNLTFTTDGLLDTVTSPPAAIDFTGATPGQAIDLDFGTPAAGGGTGLDGVTQFASRSSVSSQAQDGGSAGELAGLSIEGDGTVVGAYTNGEREPVGKLAIAKFRANNGLSRAGASLWIATSESGAAALGMAGSGGRGAISGGALEGSNVDLGQEMVDLIQHQRAYSANSKTISTADEMLATLMAIKR